MATPTEVASQVSTVFSGMTNPQKIIAAVVLVALVIGLFIRTMTGSKMQYEKLYSGLNDEDAAEVVAQLQEERMAYELSGDGRSILVPADKVHDIRLALAGAGLPRGGGVGFEIF